MSEPTLSRRGRILEELIRQLRTITKANGYSCDVVEVSQNVQNWRNKSEVETPLIYVIDQKETRTYGAGRSLQLTWTVELFGCMRNRTQEEMEEFITDIEQCLQKNQTLASESNPRGTVSHHRIQNVLTDAQMFNEIEGSQLFAVIVDFIYNRCVDEAR
jgi:hypothetical protein